MRLDRYYYWREATDKVGYGRAKGGVKGEEGEDVYKVGQEKIMATYELNRRRNLEKNWADKSVVEVPDVFDC